MFGPAKLQALDGRHGDMRRRRRDLAGLQLDDMGAESARGYEAEESEEHRPLAFHAVRRGDGPSAGGARRPRWGLARPRGGYAVPGADAASLMGIGPSPRRLRCPRRGRGVPGGGAPPSEAADWPRRFRTGTRNSGTAPRRARWTWYWELFTNPGGRPAKLASHPLLAGLPGILDRSVLPDTGSVLHGVKPVGKLRKRAGEPEIVRIERSARLRPGHVGNRAKLADRHQSSPSLNSSLITSASNLSCGRTVSRFILYNMRGVATEISVPSAVVRTSDSMSG